MNVACDGLGTYKMRCLCTGEGADIAACALRGRAPACQRYAPINRVAGAESRGSAQQLTPGDTPRHAGTKNIWALGDAAFMGLAPTAQVAFQQARISFARVNRLRRA
jgi:hypothetical protein